MQVTFGGTTYEVTINDANTANSVVKVVGGQTLERGTNNWLRALRTALKQRSK